MPTNNSNHITKYYLQVESNKSEYSCSAKRQYKKEKERKPVARKKKQCKKRWMKMLADSVKRTRLEAN